MHKDGLEQLIGYSFNRETVSFLAEKDSTSVGKALEVGISVLNRIGSSNDMDFLKGQIDALMVSVSQAAGAIPEVIVKQLEKITGEKFDPDIPSSYPERFGKFLNQSAAVFKETIAAQLAVVKDELKRIEENTSESESSLLGRARKQLQDTQSFIQGHFEGTSTGSFAYQVKAMLDKIMTGIDATVKTSIEQRTRAEISEALRPVNDALTNLRELVSKEQGKAEVFDLTSQKGFAFEDVLFEKLQGIAQPFGDMVEHSGLMKEASGSQKGDFLYTTSMRQLIVIEAKDKPVGLRESIEYMKKALEARGSRFGILCAKSPDQLQKQIGRWNVYDNILLCCADDVEISIKYARIAVQNQAIEEGGINAGSLRIKIAAMMEEMKKFATVKTQLTNMQKGVGEGADRITAVVEEMKKSLGSSLQAMEEEIAKSIHLSR